MQIWDPPETPKKQCSEDCSHEPATQDSKTQGSIQWSIGDEMSKEISFYRLTERKAGVKDGSFWNSKIKGKPEERSTEEQEEGKHSVTGVRVGKTQG